MQTSISSLVLHPIVLKVQESSLGDERLGFGKYDADVRILTVTVVVLRSNKGMVRRNRSMEGTTKVHRYGFALWG